MVLLALGYRRGVFGATPAGVCYYGIRLKLGPPKTSQLSWSIEARPFRSSAAISIEDGALLLPGLLDVCSVRCPVSVFTNLAHGVGFDAPGSAYMFTLRHATSMTRRDPEHLQRALQLHTSF